MQKRYARFLGALLCLTMIFCLFAQAAEPYASSLVTGHSATLRKGTDGYLYITFTISTNRVSDVIGASSVVLERRNGSRWEEECTFTLENTPELQTTERSYYGLGIKYKPQDSGTYRAQVNLYAKYDTTVSTGTDTTSMVDFP